MKYIALLIDHAIFPPSSTRRTWIEILSLHMSYMTRTVVLHTEDVD